eukprot:8032747-Prorocentrum_lima.AAC.1
MVSQVPKSRTSNLSVPSHVTCQGRYCPPKPPPSVKERGASSSPSAIRCSRSWHVDQLGRS